MKLFQSKLTSYLMLITTFLIPFYIFRFSVAGIPTNAFEISLLILLIVTLFQSSNERDSQKSDRKIQYVLFVSCFLFLVSSILGVWQAGFSRDSLGVLKGWVVVPMIYGWLVYKFASQGKLNSLFWGAYTSTLVVSVWAILQKLGVVTTLFYQVSDTSFVQYLGSNFRAFGPFESPNYLAMYLVPATVLSLGIASTLKSQKSKLLKVLYYLSFILPLLAINFSRSRAGLIALVGAAIIIATIVAYRKISNKLFSNLFILIAAGIYALFLIIIYQYALRPDSDAIRFEIYQHAWQFVRSNWLLGIGISQFQHALSLLPLQDSFREFGLPYALHPHNLYLAMWLNFGILGLVSFLGVTFYSAIYLLRGRTIYALLLLAALAAILIHGIFDTTYFKNDLSAIYWLIIGLAFAQQSIRLHD